MKSLFLLQGRLGKSANIVGAAMFVCLASTPVHALPIRVENFDTNPGWTSFNTTTAGNNYGFKTSNVTVGTSPAGEAGGRFARSSSRSYYADTDLNGILNLDDPIQASGEFAIETITNSPAYNGEFYVGFFDVANGGNRLGFLIRERNNSSVRVNATINGALSSQLDVGKAPRTFNFAWNPLGGVNSNGRLSVTMSGVGTVNLDLTAAQRASFASSQFNAFGFDKEPLPSPSSSNFIQLYIDGLQYTVVPEPSGLVLAMAAVTCGTLFGASRRVRRRPRHLDHCRDC